MKELDNLVKINKLKTEPADAAHVFSLAALRWHGYRSDNRYLVLRKKFRA